MVMLFVGCGDSNSVADEVQNDAPKSPITQEKGKTPPSIPNI